MPNASLGDILWRPSGLGVTHFGIALGSDLVFDIVPGGGPRVVSRKQFAAGKSVSLRRSHLNDVRPLLARMRQAADSQRLYDPIAFNCEHLKNFVLSGEKYSETVIALGLLAIVGIWALARGRGH